MNKPEQVLVSTEDNVALITLNQPEKANSFDGMMWPALEDVIRSIGSDVEVKAAVLTGAGSAFCGGLDLKAAAGDGICLKERQLRPGFETLSYLSSVFALLENLPIPVIAAINGGCIGLGLELALSCDIRLAAENATFSIPEVAFGLAPDCGGSQRLPRAVGPAMAKELIFSARRIDAPEALRIGLVNHLYPGKELLPQAKNLAATIAAHPAEAVQAAKRCLNIAANTGLSQGLAYETATALTVLGEKANTMLKTK